MIEPVVAALAAWLILGEKLSTFQYVGMFLVFFSLALNSKNTESKITGH